jgi:lipopolysaccharide export LptBFGC system permease protein LptF
MDQDEFEHYTIIAYEAETLKTKRNEIANTPESLLSLTGKRDKYAELRIHEKTNKAELKSLLYKVSEKYFTQEQVEQAEKHEDSIEVYSKNIQSEIDELEFVSSQINKVEDDRNILKIIIEESKSTDIQKQVLKNCREEIIAHESLIQKLLNDIDSNIEISRHKKSIQEN